jgi:hypothetical protein
LTGALRVFLGGSRLGSPESFATIVEFGPGWGNPAIGFPVTNPDPTRDYIYTGPGRLTPSIPQLLPQEIDDVTQNFGFKTYEAALTDPAVYSQYQGLKFNILNGPLRVRPTIRPKGMREGKSLSVEKAGKMSPKEKMSLDVAEFCERENRRPKKFFKATLNQLLDMMAFGHKLAEQTRQEVTAGADKGKLGLSHIKVKPTWAWKFVVDATMEPVGILTYVPPDVTPLSLDQQGEKVYAQGGYMILPMDKFILATWLQKDNDPRGTSALRAAYDFWNLKRQTLPFYYQHLRRFGSPSLDGVIAPGDQTDRFPVDPRTGLEVTSAPKVSPIQRYTQALLAYQNNSVIVRPAGTELHILEPKDDKGESFTGAFDLFDRQICLAISLQVRASLEAKHGSKADSQTAQDREGLVVAWGREQIGDLVTRELYYRSVLLNYGEEIAEECTPALLCGNTEQQDKATMWGAAAAAGWTIGQSQLDEVDLMIDAPERDAEADAKAQKDMAEHEASLAPDPAGSKDMDTVAPTTKTSSTTGVVTK